MNIEIFKKANTWMILVPILITLWALSSALECKRSKAEANRLVRHDDVLETAKFIVKAEGLSTKSEFQDKLRVFEGASSALLCVQAAMISESRLSRGEGSTPVKQKDGSMLHKETYRLTGVHLVQVAKFIDFAERHFTDVICTQISLNQARGKEPDLWDVTVSLRYVIQ